MSNILVLDESTINQIAAGEVVERPSAVVKELLENAMDAGATAITVEIKEGGLSFIRITDNGSGIAKEDIPLAFLRHATSKIRTAEDLLHVKSLGFRGEALSSIAAVAQVELITKTPAALNGFRYVIEGGEEKSMEEIGCPIGTTLLVRNIFYNTPARRNFLKSAMTEAGYISDLMERLIVSHPEIAFKFIANNQVKLQSSGNNNSKDILYHIYGRDITRELLEVNCESETIKIAGYIGKPVITRGNRNYENYFINGRYIKSSVITKAVEEAYKPFLMQHKYPFTSIYFEIDPSLIDVNVHPQKLEIRLKNSEEIYQLTFNLIRNTLAGKEMIPKVLLGDVQKDPIKEDIMPEPFEKNRKQQQEQIYQKPVAKSTDYITATKPLIISSSPVAGAFSGKEKEDFVYPTVPLQPEQIREASSDGITPFLSDKALVKHRIIGQLFSTYWLVEYEKELYIIDQHAAHEKVLYERLRLQTKNKTYASQQLFPPIILTLTLREQEILQKHGEMLNNLGYEFEQFGGKEYSVRAVPAELTYLSDKELLLEFIDALADDVSCTSFTLDVMLQRAASLSCKAAVKANHTLSLEEASALIKELLTLDNPYHCPHGRPVIISMSQYELERKFKRVL